MDNFDTEIQCEEVYGQDDWAEYVAYEEELQRQKEEGRTQMMGVLTPVFTWDEDDDNVEVTDINPPKNWL
jgi:hypothetical protein